MDESTSFSESIRYPKLNTYKGLYGNIPVRYPDVYIGVEVEAEGISRSLRQIPGSFKMVDDGSLKVSGKEFVTVPIKMKYLEHELDRLFKSIPKAIFSSRTSIHIHMNARDLDVQSLLVFLLLYTIFERPLYRLSGDRWHNNFCIPIRHSPHRMSMLLSYCAIRRNCLNSLFVDGISWDKYLGLNLGPLMGNAAGGSARYGTIEFRHMAGNNSVNAIMDWCNVITCLKFFARSIPLRTMITLIKDSNVSYASDMFREWLPLIEKNSVPKDIMEGNTFAKYLLQKSHLHNQVEEESIIPRPSSESMDQIIDDIMGNNSIGPIRARNNPFNTPRLNPRSLTAEEIRNLRVSFTSATEVSAIHSTNTNTGGL